MPAEITMPQQSDTMTEGTVVKWLIKEGDKVKAGQTIAEIETDKATMETESQESGTVAALLATEGQKVAVGVPIAVLATGSENAGDLKKKYASGAAAKPAAQPQQAAKAPAPKEAPAPRSINTAEMKESASVGHGAGSSSATAVAEPPPARGGNGHGERVFASPVARRVAAAESIDLGQVQGTGPGGRIVKKDVTSFAQRPQGKSDVQLPARVARGQTSSIPLTKMRAAIAAGLQKSKQTVPHFYVTVDVDLEEITALRGRMNKQLESQKIKLSISDFIYKAAAAALLQHPAVNAHFTGDSITRFGDVNLGIAVAIPDGLIVPVLRSVDQMGLKEIRTRGEDLVARARAQKLKQDEMRGATFTISNLGAFGVREFSAIINPPEVAILAISAAEKRPVVRGEQIVARTMMSMTLSADHRAVDGAIAADFLRTLKGLLEEPAMMLV